MMDTTHLFDNARTHCRCPVCGYEFEDEEIKDEGNVCASSGHRYHGPFSREELVGEWDDYEWCY